MNGSREVSAEDGLRILDRETRRELGVPVNVFLRAYIAGDFPAGWDRAALSRLEMLLPLVAVASQITALAEELRKQRSSLGQRIPVNSDTFPGCGDRRRPAESVDDLRRRLIALRDEMEGRP